MEHVFIKIVNVKVLRPYQIEVFFDDETSKKIDLEKILRGELFGPLKNVDLFNKVRVNPEINTIEWPNGADFDPSMLYQWDEVKDDFIQMASNWETE